MKSLYQKIKETYNDKCLFKRDIKGNVIYWKALVHYSNGFFKIYSFYGQVTTTLSLDLANSVSKPIYGVNQGKSNATTNEEQAYKQLESEYKNHIKKGYKYYNLQLNDSENDVVYIDKIVDKTNTDALGYAQPMKFKPFYESDRQYPYYGQYKYNGVRSTVFASNSQDLFDSNPVTELSKEGTIYQVNHLKNELRVIIDYISNKYKVTAILDGEFYLPYTPVTTISGASRNMSNSVNKKLQFIIYDLAIENYNQEQRLRMLEDARSALGLNYPDNNCLTPTVFVSAYNIICNEEEALAFLDKSLALGYEGSIFRPLDKEYAFGKRPIWAKKLKKFQDAEFEILDVIEYGNRDQKVGYGCKFVCRNDINELVFEVTVGGNDGTNDNVISAEDKMKIVDNKHLLIGLYAVVKFYERTKNDLPFHHNAIGIAVSKNTTPMSINDIIEYE